MTTVLKLAKSVKGMTMRAIKIVCFLATWGLRYKIMCALKLHCVIFGDIKSQVIRISGGMPQVC